MHRNDDEKQTIESLNNFNAPIKLHKHKRSYEEKYQLDPKLTNKFSASATNPTVQPDNKTETGVPIPDEINTEFSKEYQEENEL
jgi:hypothetical protein